MNLHEYQAKELFAKYNMPVPKEVVVSSVEEIDAAVEKLGVDSWVVKAQVHAGGRGKAGGVKLVKTKEELVEAFNGMIGTRLVTYQTDADGQPVDKVLIGECTEIKNELY